MQRPAQAVEIAAEAFLAAMKDLKSPDGRGVLSESGRKQQTGGARGCGKAATYPK